MKKIYLGLLLLFLNLEIDEISFIPNWISFILFYKGLQEEYTNNTWFQRAKIVSIPVAAVHMVSFALELLAAMGILEITNPSKVFLTVNFVIMAATTIASTFIIYWLFKGFEDLEEETDWDLRATALRRLCLAMCIFTGTFLLGGLLYGSYTIEGILIPGAYLILFVWYFVELYRSWKSYREETE